MTETVASPPQTGLLDEDALVTRILDHIEAGTTDSCGRTWREPVENYLGPERFRREVEQVLRGVPVPFCPSGALPPGGSYLARAAAGVELLAVRGTDGVVRAFRNACRHRGTALAAGSGCSKSLVCPFHGWVYGLDGSLRHVPDSHGFPGIDVSTRGLVPVTAIERSGLVFVQQDGAPQVLPDLPPLVTAEQEFFDATEDVIEANWKVMVEGFLEGYHIKATHRDTFFPLGYDNLTVIEAYGRNSRVTFPFRRIEDQRDVPPGQRRLGAHVTVVHHLFPNAIVVRLTHHSALIVLEPLTPSTTRFLTYRWTNRPIAQGGLDAARRDAAFVETGLEQDRAIARAVQRGLAGGANTALEFGHFEGALRHFHRQLAELLGGRDGRRPNLPTMA